jgi:hypothetical protein
MVVLLVVLIGKSIMSFRVYGTNDMTYWAGFSKVIEAHGTFEIYKRVKIYNHPPLMSWMLVALRFAETTTHLPFPFLFRMPAIIADGLFVLMLWRLLAPWDERKKTIVCVLCALNPISFLVSGFHGNTDPVFIFLVLLAVFLRETKRSYIGAGMVYGLSMCVKIVPILLAPAFFFAILSWRDRCRFFAGASVIPMLVFVPYLVVDRDSVARNIFQYGGLNGIWGIGHVMSSIFMNPEIEKGIREGSYKLYQYHVLYGRFLIAAPLLLFSYFFVGRRHMSMMGACFLTFAWFLTITPGFGVQYLSWLAGFSVVWFPLLGGLFTFLGGYFLYRVYSFWGGGTLYYANSDQVGQWLGADKVTDLLLWGLVVLMTMIFIMRVYRMKVGFLSTGRTE